VSGRTLRLIETIRGSTHDGPGMRTTIFLKGCPLRCTWCQNPEGMGTDPAVWWNARKCIRCLECLHACPARAITEDAHGLVLNRDACTRCGACVEACPARALAFDSMDWPLERVVREALKDRDYYAAFGGGVTVSGGEPLVQYRAVAELLERLREAGIHTALDTCGLAAADALAAVLTHTDLVLFDIKLLDPALHRAHTGQPNETILANLGRIADQVRGAPGGLKVWIRTPLIPGVTATAENIRAIGQFLRTHLPDVVERWELCAFNNACRSKYQRLGLPWRYAETPLMRRSETDALREVALAAGVDAGRLVVSGLIAT